MVERVRAMRGSLAASYRPVHAEREEDPDALMPDQYLTLGATPEEIRRAYRKYHARFEVDREEGTHAAAGSGLGRDLLHPKTHPGVTPGV